jgi:hypothetical protein
MILSLSTDPQQHTPILPRETIPDPRTTISQEDPRTDDPRKDDPAANDHHPDDHAA